MAIHIGDKVVRSLPEEVSDLRKRIDELEEPKHLYLHHILIGKKGWTEVASAIILSKRKEAYDYESLATYLFDNNFTDGESLYPASGAVTSYIVVGMFEDGGDIRVEYAGGQNVVEPLLLQDEVIKLF